MLKKYLEINEIKKEFAKHPKKAKKPSRVACNILDVLGTKKCTHCSSDSKLHLEGENGGGICFLERRLKKIDARGCEEGRNGCRCVKALTKIFSSDMIGFHANLECESDKRPYSFGFIHNNFIIGPPPLPRREWKAIETNPPGEKNVCSCGGGWSGGRVVKSSAG